MSAPVSAPVAAGPAEPVRSAAGSPLPGQDKPAPAPASLSGTGGSAAKQGVVPSGVTPSPVRSPANTAPAAPINPAGQAAAGSQATGSLQTGESLRVAHNQPYRSSAPGPVHRAAALSNPNGATEANPASQLARQAFQALGEQQSGLGNLFSQVGSLMSAQAAGKVSLPDPVAKAMQQILGLRLTPGQTTTAGDIQQSIRMSGQFREANAAFPRAGAPPAQADLKSVLMSFRSLLQQFGAEAQVTRPAAQPAPPSRQDPPQAQSQPGGRGFLPGNAPQILQALLKDADAALARVRMTQLVNTGLAGDERAQAPSRPMDLVFELPLALGQETGILQMQAGRDGSGQGDEDDKEPAWRLRFAMDLTATGPVEAAVSLRGGGTYASLWVERPATFDSLKALEETMRASFADAGLDLQELRLVRGLPPKAAARYGTLVDRQS
ncbi:MAG: flagellar hook-length control protein FliK [Pseudomonadota bacterium]